MLKFLISVNLLSPLEDSAVKALSHSFLLCRRLKADFYHNESVSGGRSGVVSKSFITMKDGTTFGYDRSTSNILYAEREKHVRCYENYLDIRVLSFNIQATYALFGCVRPERVNKWPNSMKD